MRRYCATALLSLGLATATTSAVHAQAGTGADAPVTTPAPSTTPDPARQALADQIVAIHMPEGSDAGAEEAALVIDQIISQMQASGSVQEALRKDANLRRMYDRLIADARTATLQVIRARAPQLRQATSVAYAATFTVSELQDLLVFFRTPTGQRFARSNVALLSAPSIVEWTQETDTQVQAQLEPILTRFGEEVSRAIAKTPQS